MGLFGRLKRADINEGVERFRALPGALLVDVRNRDEYEAGHIPGSVNLSIRQLENMDEIVDASDQPIFLYCLSGARSMQAAALLREQGYTRVENIGGIQQYKGELTKE